MAWLGSARLGLAATLRDRQRTRQLADMPRIRVRTIRLLKRSDNAEKGAHNAAIKAWCRMIAVVRQLTRNLNELLTAEMPK